MDIQLESKSTDTLRSLESFVKAVESGSIAAGARLLGISAAAASQNIARLEQSLGLRLLTRTTRSLALTDAGALYFERVQAVLQELELARAAVADLQDEPRGQLRIAASAAFGRHVLARGELVELFSSATPTHGRATSAPLDYYLCVRDRYELTPKVRLFMDYLQHALPANLQPSAEAPWHGV